MLQTVLNDAGWRMPRSEAWALNVRGRGIVTETRIGTERHHKVGSRQGSDLLSPPSVPAVEQPARRRAVPLYLIKGPQWFQGGSLCGPKFATRAALKSE